MSTPSHPTFTAFVGSRRLASGSAAVVGTAAHAAAAARTNRHPVIFSDLTGRRVHVDWAAGRDAIVAQLHSSAGRDEGARRRPGPGRPRLGVVAREVTLLPRHWAWLRTRRGGASATLRRLVDEARRRGAEGREVCRAQDAVYRFMTETVGDEPGYEEALRALYRGDLERFTLESEGWPQDLRDHARALAASAFRDGAPGGLAAAAESTGPGGAPGE